MGMFTDRQFIIHWLASYDEKTLQLFLNDAAQIRKQDLHKLPHEELKNLAELMYKLQAVKYTVPVTIQGNAVFTLHYYPSEETFQPPESPSLLDADMKIDWNSLEKTDTTRDLDWGRNISLSVPHEEDQIAKYAADKIPEHAAFIAEMGRVAEKYSISRFDLWGRLLKFKECMDMDAADEARDAARNKED